jgi:hypothetical protein
MKPEFWGRNSDRWKLRRGTWVLDFCRKWIQGDELLRDLALIIVESGSEVNSPGSVHWSVVGLRSRMETQKGLRRGSRHC